jgi:hypothetical protein
MNRLRFKGDSMMYEDVICAAVGRNKIRIFIAEEDGHIIGWCAALLPGTGDQYQIPSYTKNTPIYTYVNRARRGLNVGRRLLGRASSFLLKRKYKPTVFYWDDSSCSFFEDANRKIKKLSVCDIDEWWDLYE